MNTVFQKIGNIINFILPMVLLAIIAEFVRYDLMNYPYLGFFAINYNSILKIYSAPPDDRPWLEEGDSLLSVDGTPISEYEYSHDNPFKNYQQGDVIRLEVERDGEVFIVPWQLPGKSTKEITQRIIDTWTFSLVFWVIVTVSMISIYPHDKIWAQFTLLMSLCLLFILFGGFSSHDIYRASILWRIVMLVLIPVSLHFHWDLPYPLARFPGWLWSFVYIPCLVMASLQFSPKFSSLPVNYLAFLINILLNLGLLLGHYIKETRNIFHWQGIALFLLFLVVSFVTPFTIYIIGIGEMISSTTLTALSIVILPLIYIYVLNQRSANEHRFRINRLISNYTFFMMVFILFSSLSSILSLNKTLAPFLPVVFVLFALGLGIFVHPYYLRIVDKYVFNIPHPKDKIFQVFNQKISQSISLNHIHEVLVEEILPSLQIRQSYLVMTRTKTPQMISSLGVENLKLPDQEVFLELDEITPESLRKLDKKYNWILLVIPLETQGEIIGWWFFGEREPRDVYPPEIREILSNLGKHLATSLIFMYQNTLWDLMMQHHLNIFEDQRTRLANELQQDVMNSLTSLKNDYPHLLGLETVKKYLFGISTNLRSRVKQLRPPMLDQGLWIALNDLFDELNVEFGGQTRFFFMLPKSLVRYEIDFETQIYRLVQGVCESILEFGEANIVYMNGILEENRVRLNLIDNGKNIPEGMICDLNAMIRNELFDLVELVTRANNIHANLTILSQIDGDDESGVTFQIIWPDDNHFPWE